jgi:hypothetical protein
MPRVRTVFAALCLARDFPGNEDSLPPECAAELKGPPRALGRVDPDPQCAPRELHLVHACPPVGPHSRPWKVPGRGPSSRRSASSSAELRAPMQVTRRGAKGPVLVEERT